MTNDSWMDELKQPAKNELRARVGYAERPMLENLLNGNLTLEQLTILCVLVRRLVEKHGGAGIDVLLQSLCDSTDPGALLRSDSDLFKVVATGEFLRDPKAAPP